MIRKDVMAGLDQNETEWAAAQVSLLRERIAREMVGHSEVVDLLIACLLARGHALLEDVPGVGKTLLASTLSRSIDASFRRIQLTPDMLPADVLGVSVYESASASLNGDDQAREHTAGRGGFRFIQGPLFANIVLADEINRTTPRTQSALLESMNEGTVTVDGVTHALDQPFMVVATQNPFEFEGTYPLPENQLDRFLMRLSLGYPSEANEMRILETHAEPVTGEHPAAIDSEAVTQLQSLADRVLVDPAIHAYIISIAQETRDHQDLYLGVSPRGSLALMRAGKALALMQGRGYVIPEDIYDACPHVIGHRVIPKGTTDGRVSGLSSDAVRQILEGVPTPV